MLRKLKQTFVSDFNNKGGGKRLKLTNSEKYCHLIT